MRLAKRFFAFFEIGVTIAVCMMNLDLDVCNLDHYVGLVEIDVPLDDVAHLVEFQNWISSRVGTLS
jgi:hypothetical protein